MERQLQTTPSIKMGISYLRLILLMIVALIELTQRIDFLVSKTGLTLRSQKPQMALGPQRCFLHKLPKMVIMNLISRFITKFVTLMKKTERLEK